MLEPVIRRFWFLVLLLPLALATGLSAPWLVDRAPNALDIQPTAGSASFAQSTAFPLDLPLRFEHLTIDDGLSQNTVVALLQDREGFLWAATQDGGLNRYDGYNFTVYKHDSQNPNSLSQSSIISLYEDRDGMIWIGTWGGGLNRLNPNTGSSVGAFIQYRYDPGDPASLSNDIVTSILEDNQNRLWVGTCGGGLNLLDRQTGHFTRYKHDPANPASLSSDNVSTLFLDDSGALWVGSGCYRNAGAGLDRLDYGSVLAQWKQYFCYCTGCGRLSVGRHGWLHS
jgi:hypothetical protein